MSGLCCFLQYIRGSNSCLVHRNVAEFFYYYSIYWKNKCGLCMQVMCFSSSAVDYHVKVLLLPGRVRNYRKESTDFHFLSPAFSSSYVFSWNLTLRPLLSELFCRAKALGKLLGSELEQETSVGSSRLAPDYIFQH